MYSCVMYVCRPLILFCVIRPVNKPAQYLNTGMKTTSKNEDRIPIFNYVSSTQNPVTWGEFMKLNEFSINYPSFKCMWYYFFCLNKHKLIHNIYIIFLHLLPALFTDIGAKIMGKQPM
jgi:fatty acyl-CoA reductase